jgi:hypothetical protein
MFHKLVEPMMFPLILLCGFWFMERNKSPDRKPDRQRMRFWMGVCSLLVCVEYALVWHWEIGSAWQNHPNGTLFATLAIFVTIFASAGPLPDLMKKL